LFLTQEKAIRRILQDRERGDLTRAREHAVEALEKFPGDYDLAIEAAQACLDLADYPQAANILKNAHKRHGDRRAEIMEFARSAFTQSHSILIGSLIIEIMLRARDLDGIGTVMGGAPEAFLADLVKRADTKAKNLAAEGQDRSTLAGENELLLGLARLERKEYDLAVASLGRALEILPGEAQPIGGVLMQIERELPANADVKFDLGLASALLAHSDKAEARFFQCLELANPPLEKILATIDALREAPPNNLLLRGEVLLRLGRVEEGVAAVRGFLAGAAPGSAGEGSGGTDREKLVEARLSLLPQDAFASRDVALLYADAAAGCGRLKQAIGALGALAARGAEYAPRIAEWIEGHEQVSSTAEGRLLLARTYIESGDIERGAEAARLAADANAAVLPALLDFVRAPVEGNPDADPRLAALLSELYARAGNRESAEEILGGLKRRAALPEDALMALSGEIMRRCGILLTGVVSILEITLPQKKASAARSYVIDFCREKPEEHGQLASDIEGLAEKHPDYWGAIAELFDSIAKEEPLSAPLRFLRAHAHLLDGKVEGAVFEFDQLTMADAGLRSRLIDIYEEAARRFDSNATLELALYHAYLDEGQLPEAAHHLGRTLAIDPKQIRDVMARFEKLIEREPDNPSIWEEMLKTALAINHTNLAKEILKRAVASASPGTASALQVYAARVAAAEGRWEDSLRSVAAALASPQANLRSLEEEIRRGIARDPSSAEAHFLLGETLLRAGSEAAGVAAFERCLHLSPGFRAEIKDKLTALLPLCSEPWLLASVIGEIAWAEGQRDEAFQHFAAAQKGPRESLASLSRSLERLCTGALDDLRLAVLYARNLTLEKRYREAVAILERLMKEDPNATRTVTDVLLTIVGEAPTQLEANRLLARIFICSGQSAEALEPLVRLMSDETADPAALDAVASEFIPLFEKSAPFLIAYAGLKARRGELEEALARYRKAFDVEPVAWNAVLASLGTSSWPGELRETEALLRADCLLAGERSEEAFAALDALRTTDVRTVEEVVRRLRRLIERAPDKRYFSLGAALLALARQTDAAESLVSKGCGMLDTETALDLRIEFGEILYRTGNAKRGEHILSEALSAAANRRDVLHRIERASEHWTARERAGLAERLATGEISDAERERLAALALDRGDVEDALRALAGSAARSATRSVLLGRAYLAIDRPALALAALGSVASGELSGEAARNEALYTAGLASEMIGDHGRAASSFAAIAASDGAYRDSRARALNNYTQFLESRCAGGATVLEKTDFIDRSRTEEES